VTLRPPLPILAINLDRDTGRMADTQAAFAGLDGFALRRSPGVIPALPHAAKTCLARQDRIQDGTLGVFLAHVLAWETIAALDGPALVIEDDTRPGSLHRLFALTLPDDLDVLHVNHRMADPARTRGEQAIVPAATILPHKLPMLPSRAAPGGDGYLLTPAGAKKLIRAVRDDGFGGHVDWRLLRYGCTREAMLAVGRGTWLEEHRPMRAGEGAPQWGVVRSYRTTHPLIRLRGSEESTRQQVSGLAPRKPARPADDRRSD
jgi:GR25 family glycosyltransferase involved in LPS biosynthesis